MDAGGAMIQRSPAALNVSPMYSNALPSNGTSPQDNKAAMAAAAAAAAQQRLNGAYPYGAAAAAAHGAATADTLAHHYPGSISTSSPPVPTPKSLPYSSPSYPGGISSATSPVPKPLPYATPNYHGLISTASSMLPPQNYASSHLMDFTGNLAAAPRFPFYSPDVTTAAYPSTTSLFDPMGLSRYDMHEMAMPLMQHQEPQNGLGKRQRDAIRQYFI